jgi:UDP-N-acetylmuramoylalanine--D-glutamate ligase
MGGADKNLDMSGLAKEIPKYCKAVVLLSGTGTKKFKNDFADLAKGLPEFDNLKSAVKAAVSLCKKGDTLILSPSFASFGMFKNEYDRGEKFIRLIKALK